jgi:hypothetical protein
MKKRTHLPRYAKPIQNPSPHPPSPNLKIEDSPYKKIKQKLSRSMKIRGGMRKNPRLRSANMDIIEAFTNQSFNKRNKTRGVNPISVSNQNNRL